MAKLTGAQIVWESLVREGVEVVFGIPGGGAIHLYHALPEYPIHHVLMRHEQSAAHAADGYARSTGKVGVCVATSGPGATNLITGLATALRDSSPVVAITGQAHSAVLGTDAFQEVDIVGITLPVTKHNYLVSDTRDLARAIREAFFIAQTGQPGPVLVCITADAQVEAVDYAYPDDVSLPGYRPEELQRPVEGGRGPANLSDVHEWQADSAQPEDVASGIDRSLWLYIVENVRQAAQDEATLVCGDRHTRLLAIEYFAGFDRRCVLSPSGFETRGFHLPAAIGAQMGRPDKQVWVMTDDASFQMTIQELSTVVQERLPLKMVIYDRGYSAVTHRRRTVLAKRCAFGAPVLGPEFTQIGEAYGIPGLAVRKSSELAPALEYAAADAGPVLIDCQVTQMTLASDYDNDANR